MSENQCYFPISDDKKMEQPISERNFSGITMGVSAEGFAKVAEELAQCRKRIVSIVAEDKNVEKVCRLNMQLFPLTENICKSASIREVQK